MNITNTITFREAIKLVHPDINKNVIDASYKVTQIKLHRNDERLLYNLLTEWGDLTSNNKLKTYKYKNSKKTYTSKINVGDLIFIKTRGLVCRVCKITPKRYYFMNNGVRTFCNKKNAVKYFKK